MPDRQHQGHPLTAEQNHAVDLALALPPALRIEAFAGAGKTSTLAAVATALAAELDICASGTYAAFNKAIVTDAQGVFPPTTEVRTMHSLAYRSMVRELPQMPERLKSRLNGRSVASLLQLSGNGPFTKQGIGALVLDTFARFCNSADAEILPRHVPFRVEDRIKATALTNNPLIAEQLSALRSRGVTVQAGKLVGPATDVDRAWFQENARDVIAILHPDREIEALRQHVSGLASDLFAAMRSDSRMPLTHDSYLKLWALSKPKLNADYILFDEAQDASPVMLELLRHQDASVIYVGDRYQEIYGWRGAVNALDSVHGPVCRITQSFRFGQPIADLASAILNNDLDANVAIRGFGRMRSRVVTDGSGSAPDAILGRSNSAVLNELLSLADSGRRVFMVGGSRDFCWMVESLDRLSRNQQATHPDLADFESWAELKAYTETESGRDLKAVVNAVETHGADRLLRALDTTAQNESQADVVLSTAHKAKGRQWGKVRLLGDFRVKDDEQREGKRRKPWSPAESRIAYVSATRGKQEIDITSCRGLCTLYRLSDVSEAA